MRIFKIIILSFSILFFTSCSNEEKVWQQALMSDSLAVYEAYLQQFPDGKYKENAQFKIDSIKNAEDNAAWEKAIELNTIESYENYLTDFSEGIHVTEAKNKIEELKKPVERVVLQPSAEFLNFVDSLKNVPDSIFEQKFVRLAAQLSENDDVFCAMAKMLAITTDEVYVDSLIETYFAPDSCFFGSKWDYAPEYADIRNSVNDYIGGIGVIFRPEFKQMLVNYRDTGVENVEDTRVELTFNAYKEGDIYRVFMERTQTYIPENEDEEGSQEVLRLDVSWKKYGDSFKIVKIELTDFAAG